MQPYHKFLEHTADELFVAEAVTLGELFEQCALAVEEVQVNLLQFTAKKNKEIVLKNKNIEYLLFDFLDELLFVKDSEQIIFAKFSCQVNLVEGEYVLKCVASGEKIDPAKHEQKVDIKAITMHMFKVEKTALGWKAKVLVDI